MATLTARPQEKLTIKHKRVLDAYFAERINDPQYEGEKDIYTVKSGDSISKIANKKGTTVSDIIANNTDITSANKHLIKVGQKINITKQTKKGDKVSFKRMDAANLGDEVYVIVKTENLSGVEVCINVKQGKTDNPEVESESKGMFIAQEGNNDISLAKATVGAYSNDSEITNKDDFANWAIFKITLGARHQEEIDKALEKLDDKKAFLFLVVDAHTRNKIDINYDGQNEDDETTFTNRWLDIKGKWFELGNNINKNYIYINRFSEKWTGKNKSSMTFGTYKFGDLTGYTCEPYGEETEDSGKDKRIPAGEYNIKWHVTTKYPKNKYTLETDFGKKFQLDYEELKNGVICIYNDKVSANRGILMHAGQDGGWTVGCVLPSSKLDKTLNKRNMNIKESVECLHKILDKIDDIGINQVKIVITDETD